MLNMNAKSKSIRLNKKKAPLFTIVGGVVLINPAYAQNPPPQDLEEVIVTGLRVSLQMSADIKRTANGVVDAISAEDIGKFPDTNLAEACSASPASRSTAATAKARRSRRAASARSSTWSP